MRFAGVFACVFLIHAAAAASLTVPFDFSKSEIGLDVMVGQTPLYVILDTGVDPSVIDLTRAETLHLELDRNAGGQASGEGNAADATVFPATIKGLRIAGRSFPPVDALAADMSGLSAHYGRRLDGVLGFSFLDDKIVLVDYPHATVSILDRPGDARVAVQSCRRHHSIAMTFFPQDNTPAIPQFRFGNASGAISLDTGSSGSISLYPKALALPGLKQALEEKGETTYAGARGEAKGKTYVLRVPVGFGPFRLPAGQTAVMQPGQADGRVANIGNKLFAAMKLKMLLDYRDRRITFYGDCR